ncbi:MAG TPA: DUF6629 family protein [Gemmataceae bacterium]|jgi:hypothetical protein|nr:DUF6629 family protein [Gemmataceae bacterium]
MCFSAEASLGVAVVLLPVGGFCVAAAWHKDRRYLLLAVIPLLFGLQQVCEAGVWAGLGRAVPELGRAASRSFLFFALAFWPVWVPLSAAAVEPPGARRTVCLALAGLGLTVALVYYPPLVPDGGWAGTRIVGHSIRHDFSAIPAVHVAPGWVWPAAYLSAVCAPFLAVRDHRLWPLGAAVAVSAAVSYVAFREAFASVWCFLAAILSVYIAYVLHGLRPNGFPDSRTPEPVSAL